MRKLATLLGTSPVLRKVGAFPYVLLVAVEAFLAVTEDGEVATDTLASADVDVRKMTIWPRAATVDEVSTERSPLRSRIVRERARLVRVWALVVQKVPTNGNLRRVVLIDTSEATVTRA